MIKIMSFSADEYSDHYNANNRSGVEIIENSIYQWQIIKNVTDDQIISISFTDLVSEAQGTGSRYTPKTHEVRARVAYKV